MKYNADYFIKKFSKIPARLWTVGSLGEGLKVHCALGHCGVKSVKGRWKHTRESAELTRLFGGRPDCEDGNFSAVYEVNDLKRNGSGGPRDRVLAALRKLKKEGK